MVEYDKHYKSNNYFGKPYMGLIEFFEKAKRGTLVDLGAGQGRDSIQLSEMGYSVTAVDISSVGISQIKESNPNINIVICDLFDFDTDI